MNSKAIKRQLLAAIAMVLVAAIALGSSTYAWFANNSSVTARTSTISAQTNAASLVIKYNATAVNSDLTSDVASISKTPLYPAQWKNTISSTTYQFETGYGVDVTSTGYTLKDGTLKAVGTPEQAVTAEYAVKNVFNITTKGSGMEDLKVTGAAIATGDTGNTQLDNALRVLVVCGDNWVLCDKVGVVKSSHSTPGYLADAITAGTDTEVDLYVFYDGNDPAIYTNNLTNLADASARITVTFGATDPMAV